MTEVRPHILDSFLKTRLRGDFKFVLTANKWLYFSIKRGLYQIEFCVDWNLGFLNLFNLHNDEAKIE